MKQHSALNRGIMFEWLKDLDDTGDGCPSDDAIMERFDFDTPEQARTLLADLADKGLITVRGVGADRVVTIGAVKPSPAAVLNRPVPSVVRPERDVERTTQRIMDIVARSPSVVSPGARVPVPAPIAAPSAPVLPDPPRTRQQVNIKISAEHYAQLVANADREDIAVSTMALRMFERGFDAAEPIHKPLIRAHVIRAARAAGIPIEEFVAGLIECGLQRFLADVTREIAA